MTKLYAALVALTLLVIGQGGTVSAEPQPERVLVFAAASLTDALNAVAAAYVAEGHPRPVFSYAASSALARQIESGAPANLFISADEEWMDYLAARHLIDPASRVSFLGNKLVLIAPKMEPFKLRIAPDFALAQALGGDKLAMADPTAVPAGKYGKAALEALGVWSSVAGNVVRSENVRATLALVERDEAAAGIVYATDAASSPGVVVVGVFPDGSYPPITYPLALVAENKSATASEFRAFLLSDKARAIYRHYGFIVK